MHTKATLLMTHNAPTTEWLFEIRAMATLSGKQWDRRNHFLLGYTVARLIAAQKSQGIHSAAEREPTAAALSAFVDEFTESVSHGDAEQARWIWVQAAADRDDAGAVTPIISLVNRVRTRPVGQSWGAMAEHLPAPSGGLPDGRSDSSRQSETPDTQRECAASPSSTRPCRALLQFVQTASENGRWPERTVQTSTEFRAHEYGK